MAVRTTIRVLLHMAKSSRIFSLRGDRGCVILGPEVGQACAPRRADTWCAWSWWRAACCSARRPRGAPCAGSTSPPPSARHGVRAVGRRGGRGLRSALRRDREPRGARRRARRLQPARPRLLETPLPPARGTPVKRVLVPLAPGFEEIEAVTIIDVLRRAGVTVDVAGTEAGPITGSHGITVTPDRTLAGVDAAAYDLVALPGGMPGTLHLRDDAEVRRVVRELAARGRYTTAICAAPTVLAAAGVTAGRAITSHPSVAAELAQAGTTYRTDAVVADGPVITSRGAGTAIEFALTLVAPLVDHPTAERLRQQMVAPAAAL